MNERSFRHVRRLLVAALLPGPFGYDLAWLSRLIATAVGQARALAVVEDGKIIRIVSGSYFTPRTLLAGRVALYARHPTTVSLLRNAVGAEVRSFVGDRDCTGATFIQCGPVVVRAGKPYIDYLKYKDISRTAKLGARAFVGIDNQHHLYFIVTPAHVRLQFGDVSLALSRLGLFTHVVTLDGDCHVMYL